jgi:hypothetical protein
MSPGRLTFDITETKDENQRLVIYASLDYKRGSGVASQILWRLVRAVFPEFVHDVVWNHAMCTIKEDVEHGTALQLAERGAAIA